jgi:hypothetical protein
MKEQDVTMVFLWNDKKPVESLDGITFSIVDKETGQLACEGASLNIILSKRVMFISDANKQQSNEEEKAND